jgi:hypothetical protein
MTEIAALLFCLVLFGLSVFQIALIAGIPLGAFAWGGQHRVLPKNLRIGSVIALLLYCSFAVVILDRAALIALLPDAASSLAAWAITAYSLLGAAMNSISRSQPEKYVMTPVAIVLGALSMGVALS